MVEKITADIILRLLQEKYAKPNWCCFAELSNATGARKTRQFDFYAFAVIPSLAYRTIGVEIKTSRSDFAHELNDPLKRRPLEAVAGECFFATPPNLIQTDEVPENWGLFEVRGSELVVRKQPQQRKIETLPIAFTASLARRFADPPVEPLPPALWKLAGEEINIPQLQEIIQEQEKIIKSNLNLRIESLEAQNTSAWKEIQRLQQYYNEIVYIFGRDARTPEQLRSAIQKQRFWTDTQQKRLDHARQILDEISKTMEKQDDVE